MVDAAALVMRRSKYDGRHYSGGCDDLPYGTWHVHVDTTGDEIVVTACDYCKADFSFLRRHGHMLDNWSWRYGMTHPKPKNLDKAIRACHRWCERKNAKIKAVDLAVRDMP